MTGLRLMVYDATCRGQLVGLTHAWMAGAGLYRTLGRLNASFGATSWDEALQWLATYRQGERIEEVQFWGHGNWGCAKIDGQTLSANSTKPGHAHHKQLHAVKERLTPESLWWFRTCETFGADAGHRFAQTWSDFFECQTAGHTFIIAYWQSGLHRLKPGESPSWAADEGLRQGTAAEPARALWSKLSAPNTISCLRGAIPENF